MAAKGRDSKGRFAPGSAGRPVGFRNWRHLDEVLERAIGKVVTEAELVTELKQLRERDPLAFLQFCGSFARGRTTGRPMAAAVS